jgi:hypothetical protein
MDDVPLPTPFLIRKIDNKASSETSTVLAGRVLSVLYCDKEGV